MRQLAASEHRSIGQVISEAIERYRREKFWEDMHAGFARIQGDPTAWQEYQDELALWDTMSADGLEYESDTGKGRVRHLPTPHLGEVWMVVFDPARGHEQGGGRPALALSNDAYDRTPHTLVIAAPITRTARGVPSHVPIQPPEGGLGEPSFVVCEQVRAISITRLRRRMGSVDPATVALAQEVVGLFIDR